MVISHNLAAMSANRQLNITGISQGKSAEKLSSGYKINRSADDAAGLSISEKMRSQIRGLNQGGCNTQDGISLLQVADGALAEVHDMIHRINELAIQAANDTNNIEDRDAIQKEINELVTEINRVSHTTEFNKIPLFQGGSSKSIPYWESKTSSASGDPSVPDKRKIMDSISSSLTLSGVPSGLAAGTYTINADSSGITINGDNIDWSNVKTTSNDAISDDPIAPGNYSFAFKGLNIGFSVPDNAELEDVSTAINKASFSVNKKTTYVDTINISSYTIGGGTNTNSFLNRNDGRLTLRADTTGINVDNKNTIAWSEIGIDDLTNAGGKTFSLYDNYYGIRINGSIADDATANDIINAFNSTSFSYKVKGIEYEGGGGYVNRGYNATNIVKVPNASTCYSLKNPYLSSLKVYGDNFYNKLGYTDRESMVQSLHVSIALMDDDDGNPMARITDKATGNYYDEHMECIDPSTLDQYSSTGKFKFAGTKYNYSGTGSSATVWIYASKSSSESLEFDPVKRNAVLDWLGTLGEIASDVTVPSPFTLSYYANRSPRYSFSAGAIQSYNENSNSGNTSNSTSLYGKSPFANEKLELWIHSGADVGNGMFITVGKMNSNILGLNGLNVSSYYEAQNVIEKAGNATIILSEMRSKLGAQQNRLEHTYNNTENIAENTQAAESRIRDTDMAAEMVRFSKENILAQVGQSMLAQSNQSRQGILSLLQ